MLSTRCLIRIFTFRSFHVGAAGPLELKYFQASSRDSCSKSSSPIAPPTPTQAIQGNLCDQFRWAMMQKTHELTAKLSMSRPAVPLQQTTPFVSHARNHPIPNLSLSSRTQPNLLQFKCPLCFLLQPSQVFLNDHMRKEHDVLI